MWETWVQSLSWKDPLEKGKAPHSSILAWRIPWSSTESEKSEQISLSLSLYEYITLIYIYLSMDILGFSIFFTMMNSPAIVSKLLSHARTKQRFSTAIRMNMTI